MAPKESKPVVSGNPPNKHTSLPPLFRLATTRVLCWTSARERRGCRQGRPQRGSPENRPGLLVVRLRAGLMAHQPRDPIYLTHPLRFVSPGPKRPRGLQEDTPEPKRRRTARNMTRRALSEAEAPQSSSGSSASSEGNSELAALRRTLQQVQEDLSALQKDQRQLDDVTRGIQHDLDEAQPYNTLRFLEEHFTCAL